MVRLGVLAALGVAVVLLVGWLLWPAGSEEPSVVAPSVPEPESPAAEIRSVVAAPEVGDPEPAAARRHTDPEDARHRAPMPVGQGRVWVRVFAAGRELRGVPLELYQAGEWGGVEARVALESGRSEIVPLGGWKLQSRDLLPRFSEAFGDREGRVDRDVVLDVEQPRAVVHVEIPYPTVEVHIVPEFPTGRLPKIQWYGVTSHGPGDSFGGQWPVERGPMRFWLPVGRTKISLRPHGFREAAVEVDLVTGGDEPTVVRIPFR